MLLVGAYDKVWQFQALAWALFCCAGHGYPKEETLTEEKKQTKTTGELSLIGLWIVIIVGCICVVVLFGRSTCANFSLAANPIGDRLDTMAKEIKATRILIEEQRQQVYKLQRELHEQAKKTRYPF